MIRPADPAWRPYMRMGVSARTGWTFTAWAGRWADHEVEAEGYVEIVQGAAGPWDRDVIVEVHALSVEDEEGNEVDVTDDADLTEQAVEWAEQHADAILGMG